MIRFVVTIPKIPSASIFSPTAPTSFIVLYSCPLVPPCAPQAHLRSSMFDVLASATASRSGSQDVLPSFVPRRRLSGAHSAHSGGPSSLVVPLLLPENSCFIASSRCPASSFMRHASISFLSHRCDYARRRTQGLE